MKAGDELGAWELAQERLDERRDPLADPEWAQGLESATRHDLEQLARRLSLLERPPRAPLGPRLAAAALVFFAPVAVWLVARDTGPERALERAQLQSATLGDTEAASSLTEQAAPEGIVAEAAPERPMARVLHYRLVSETRRAGERTLSIRTPQGIEHRRESSRADAEITLAWNQRSFRP